MNRKVIWQSKFNRRIMISSLANCAILMALTTNFFTLCSVSRQQEVLLPFVKYLWNFPDTVTCYLLSHCQFQRCVYLGTSSVIKRCLHSYQHLHCHYSATVVTLSVLELVQLADILRYVVVYFVKYMNCNEMANGSPIMLFCEGWRNSNYKQKQTAECLQYAVLFVTAVNCKYVL
jgi:hypothetical protein